MIDLQKVCGDEFGAMKCFIEASIHDELVSKGHQISSPSFSTALFMKIRHRKVNILHTYPVYSRSSYRRPSVISSGGIRIVWCSSRWWDRTLRDPSCNLCLKTLLVRHNARLLSICSTDTNFEFLGRDKLPWDLYRSVKNGYYSSERTTEISICYGSTPFQFKCKTEIEAFLFLLKRTALWLLLDKSMRSSSDIFQTRFSSSAMLF